MFSAVWKLLHRNNVLTNKMKKILFAFCALTSVTLFAGDSPFEIAQKLYGKIYVTKVEGFEDYTVRVTKVDGLEHLRVKIVPFYASAPGQWEFVKDESLADFKIRYTLVEGLEDITIRFVQLHEGPSTNPLCS